MTERLVSCFERLTRALAQPVDSAFLAAFRCLFGLTMFVSMLRFLLNGWIDSFFVKPAFHFKYYLFEWVEPLSRTGLYLVFAALALCAFCVALGLFFRVAAALFALGFVYIQLIDVTTYLNHYYLANLLSVLLLLSPAGRAYSLDALRGRSNAREVPRFWLALFRFQVGVVYTFAGLAKLQADWLVHGQPLRIWLASRTDLPLLGPLFRYSETALIMSWAGFLFDSFILWFLLWRKTRPLAYLTVLLFHGATSLLFPIGMFPVIMVLSALVFFPPNWPRTLLNRLRLSWFAQLAPAPRDVRIPGWALALTLVYCTFQVAWPLRFLAYGGDVRWHEQGMRFSWRVMVREKNGSVLFHVRQRTTGRVFFVSPHRYLTRLQESEMASQPDLILQFAHFLRDEYARRGLGDVEITVDALASMNGRRMHPLIDPRVNLATVADGLGKARWILPAPTERPQKVRPI